MGLKRWWNIYGGAVIVITVALVIIFSFVWLAVFLATKISIIAFELSDNVNIAFLIAFIFPKYKIVQFIITYFMGFMDIK